VRRIRGVLSPCGGERARVANAVCRLGLHDDRCSGAASPRGRRVRAAGRLGVVVQESPHHLRCVAAALGSDRHLDGLVRVSSLAPPVSRALTPACRRCQCASLAGVDTPAVYGQSARASSPRVPESLVCAWPMATRGSGRLRAPQPSRGHKRDHRQDPPLCGSYPGGLSQRPKAAALG